MICCVQLCMLETVEGELCLLEVTEVMRCVLGTLYNAGGCGGWALLRGFEISFVATKSCLLLIRQMCDGPLRSTLFRGDI